MAINNRNNLDESLPCTYLSSDLCWDCHIKGSLMCRFEGKDMLHFFMLVFPYAAAVITGVIHSGFGVYLLFWLAYSLSFFFIWEAHILCRHCPFWAEPGHVLHCHANYGVYKFWKFQPGPMSKSERMQFIIGALIWIAFPFPILVAGHEYLISFIALCAAISTVFMLRDTVCDRCVNFSCPLNKVPKPLVDAYLKQNPRMRKAWEKAGYHLGE